MSVQSTVPIRTPTTYIGRWIRALRTARDISQAELARRTGLHHTAFSRIESGDRLPSRDTLQRIASVLDVSPSLLCIAAGYLPDTTIKQLNRGVIGPRDVYLYLLEMESDLCQRQ